MLSNVLLRAQHPILSQLSSVTKLLGYHPEGMKGWHHCKQPKSCKHLQSLNKQAPLRQ
jgi:hypothetical protein